MIPTTSCDTPRWLDAVLCGIECVGCAVVEGVVDEDLLAAARPALRRAQERVREAVGMERLRSAGELGVIRLPMLFEETFFRFLELPEVLAVVDRTVSATAVLHLQNGLLLPPFEETADSERFQLQLHMDFRRVLNGYLCSVNTLFALDEFTARNGATLVVPGSHQKSVAPDLPSLAERALPVECPAGSMIVFDSTIWHAAGRNRSGRDRLALNQQFTRSYLKPQIDYVRALGESTVLAQRPRTQQMLGWYTRVPASLDDYYRPAEDRLYRAGQG